MRLFARVVKLVYTYALGAYAARRAGSSPVAGTRVFSNLMLRKYSVFVDTMEKNQRNAGSTREFLREIKMLAFLFSRKRTGAEFYGVKRSFSVAGTTKNHDFVS